MPASPRRKTPKSHTLATKTAELAMAAPQVVAHRMARMALSGPVLNQRDRDEFKRMSSEKTAAFQESWQAMWQQSCRAQWDIGAWVMRAMASPATRQRATPSAMAAQIHGAALGVMSKGLAPVHRKAVANAKRLSRTKLR